MPSTVVSSASASYNTKKPGLYAGYVQWYADLPRPTPILEERAEPGSLKMLVNFMTSLHGKFNDYK